MFLKSKQFEVRNNFLLLIFLAAGLFAGCGNHQDTAVQRNIIENDTPAIEKKDTSVLNIKNGRDTTDLEKILIQKGLVNINDLDSTIFVDLKYSGTDNFTSIDLYGEFDQAYLQPDVAEKLVKVSSLLKDTFPYYRLIVYDAVRPRSIQKMMWDSIKLNRSSRSKYLSNPKYGSLHNYGAAVDLSIADSAGIPLDMGTKFDAFDERSQPALENSFLKSGKLTQEQINNRMLLRELMKKAGFHSIATEWWHFSVCGLKKASAKYACIENHIPDKPVQITSVDDEDVNITFRVQILISKSKISTDHSKFKGLKVEYYKHEGYYKYTTGRLTTLEGAYALRDSVRDNCGFRDAWVTPFNNETRIGIRDAVELTIN